MRRKAGCQSAEQCPAAVQRHRMRGNTGRGMFPCPPGHKGKQTGPLWFLQQKARSRGELERAVRGDALVLALLSVREAERELRAQSSILSHWHTSLKCAEKGLQPRSGSSQVTEVWWGHSGLGNDSAGTALRSLHWPEWECCSHDAGDAGWGCFLVLGTHLQKSQVFLGPGKSA